MTKQLKELWRRLRFYARRGQFDRDLEEEMRFHLDMKAAENRAAGMTEQAAQATARRQFGNRTLLGEASREVWAFRFVETLFQDLRYGLRVLRRSPGFTAVAVLTLALGIGANTAIFQLLDAVRLRALPVQNPQELAGVRIADMTGARGSFNNSHPIVTNALWERIRDRQQAFSGLFAWNTDTFNLTTGGEARSALALWVSGDFFNVLGIRPVLGRVFAPADDERGCGTPGAVISYAFWQREFGADPSVIGRKLTLDSHPVEIIGVTPASFFGLEIGRSFDVAMPVCAEALLRGENNRLDAGASWWLTVMGRLKPGWSLEQAATHLNSISPGIFEATLPPNYPPENVKDYLGFKLTAFPAGTGVSQLRETYESPLWLLLGLAGMVLLIACANLANLMLARASAREREIAVRLALGAWRGRLIRQLLAESLLLAAMGAGLGIFLAQTLSRFLVSLLSAQGDSVFLDLGPDWRVLAFTAGLAVLTCVVFGLTPAARATRTTPGAALKTGGRGLTAGRERFGLRRTLVVLQVALSLVLLVGALLFSRSLGKLLTLDVGFRQDGILITQVDLTALRLPVERRQAFKRELLDRIRAVPGVEAAANASIIPLSGNAWGNDVWMDGADAGQQKNSFFNRVSAGYFKTLNMALLAGRDFDDRDTAASPKVAIVNEAFARQHADGANPVGKRFWVEATPNNPATVYEIVGLVKDAKYWDLREDFAPVAFLPAPQNPRPGEYDRILVRSDADLSGLIAAVRQAVGEINPRILIGFQALQTQIQNSLLRERLMATLSGFFGALALLLACVGLYGLMSYNVAGRTNEIGIRMALGAARRQVLWLILRESLLLVMVGVVTGLPVALAAARLISSLLFGLTPADPVSMCLAALLMFAVAAVAGYLPARRATKIEPMAALRYE